jgi:fucose permease
MLGCCRFLSICGPPKYSEIHLNLAQAVQGVGSMAAPLLASYVFFKNISDSHRETLVNVAGVAGKELELEKGEERHVEEVG